MTQLIEIRKVRINIAGFNYLTSCSLLYRQYFLSSGAVGGGHPDTLVIGIT
ncbi:MAG: hypothetical protein OXD32_01160 [Endozoicomonadaceae bacterium]|nr:hypothetical protein [Endozoicomonadaceae bacterium]